MKKYVLTVVLPTKGDGLDKYSEKLEKTIKAMKGKISKTVSLGKKQLAYQIQKQSEGIFGEMELEMETPAMVELEKKLAVDKLLLRHLLIKKED